MAAASVNAGGVSDDGSSDAGEQGHGDDPRAQSPVFEKSLVQPWHPLGAPTPESSSALAATPSPTRPRGAGGRAGVLGSGGGGGGLVLSEVEDDGDTFSDDEDEEDYHQAHQDTTAAAASTATAGTRTKISGGGDLLRGGSNVSGGVSSSTEAAEKRRKATALRAISHHSQSRSPIRRPTAQQGNPATRQSQGGWSDAGLSTGGVFPSSSSGGVSGGIGASEGAGSGAAGGDRSMGRSYGLKREIRGTYLQNTFKELKADGGEGGSSSSSKSPRVLASTSASSSFSSSMEHPPAAVSLRLRAPLVLHNLLCAPMLYRVVNRQGLISAEGTLPVGASVPLHRVDLCQKQYASFLLVNYPWSDFVKVHSPTSAHPLREKVREVEVRGLKVSVPGEAPSASSSSSSKKGRELPGLHLHVALQVCVLFVLSREGRDLSFFCRRWLANRKKYIYLFRFNYFFYFLLFL